MSLYLGSILISQVYDGTNGIGKVYDGTNVIWVNGNPFDSSTEDFMNATGISESDALKVNDLVIGLKSSGLWDKMYAVYPFIGNSIDSQKYNLINTGSYTITENGTLTYNDQGWTKVTTGAHYLDTNFNDNSSNWSYLNNHMSFYMTASVQGGGSHAVMGATIVSPSPYNVALDTTWYWFMNGDFTNDPFGQVAGNYLYTVDPTNSKPTIYYNGSQANQYASASYNSHTNKDITIGAVDNFTTSPYATATNWYGTIRFATIGESLSATDANNLNDIINAYLNKF